MKSIKLLAAVAALAVSSAALAEGPRYTYVDLGLLSADQGDDDNRGIALRGSIGFADIFHVVGQVSGAEALGGKSAGTPGADVTAADIAFGVNPAITDSIDLVARIGYRFIEAEGEPVAAAGNVTVENQGLTLEIGPRAMITDKLELNAAATLFTGESEVTKGCNNNCKTDVTDWGYRVGGEYYFTPLFSLGLDLAVTDINAVNLHARFTF